MDIFDPHVHMMARVTDDYERMALAGVRAVCEPAFWLGEPRTNAGSFRDYFNHILRFEADRAMWFGIEHYACIAMISPVALVMAKGWVGSKLEEKH
jgi:predicted metal-dependent TIM-barrel fold hydrolase